MARPQSPELRAYYAKGWIEDLRSIDPKVRKHAAEEIGRLRFQDESVNRALRIIAASDPDEAARLAARNTLTVFGVSLTEDNQPAVNGYETKEFGSQQAYSDWLDQMGNRIEIVSVSESKKNWSLGAGFLTNAKTITLTFKRKELTDESDTKECPFCAETIKRKAKVCRYCGRDLPN